MIDAVRKEIETLEKALNVAKKEIEILPKGHLHCSRSNHTDQYLIDGKYVSKKNIEWIRGVAQREYYEDVIPVMDSILKKLYSVEELYRNQAFNSSYKSLCNARKKLVTPLFDTVEEKIQAFLAEQYSPGKFEEENRSEFYTAKGERVRSKSELLISERLCKYEIPYHYEKPIELCDWHRVVVCRPDFTVMNKRTGNLYLYEHLGRMDDSWYVENCMRKLDLYEKNGYLIGKNLIITRETTASPLNIGKVDSYIKEFFL